MYELDITNLENKVQFKSKLVDYIKCQTKIKLCQNMI